MDDIEILVEFTTKNDQPAKYNLKHLVDMLSDFHPTDSQFHREIYRKWDDLQILYKQYNCCQEDQGPQVPASEQ